MKKAVLVLFLFLSIILCGIFCSKTPETELMKAFSSTKQDDILINLANLASKKLNVIFEADTKEDAEQMQAEFPINSNFDSLKNLTEIYKNHPINFLTEHSRNLIKNNNYGELRKEGYERVYNPLMINISTPDKDPYLFGTEFLLSNLNKQNNEIIKYQGKYYAKTTININSTEDIKTALKNQKEGIYLTGSPVHSYTTAKKSALEINIICLISTLALFLLCKIYFKSSKIFIPIVLSILFGIFLGWAASSIVFGQLHVLTFVFSTSLIGISLDYSIHYLVSGKGKNFKKNLTISMLTTVFAFLTLYFSGVNILRQIAVFTIFGLIGVYTFVLTIFPLFSGNIQAQPLGKTDFSKYKNLVITLIFLVCITGFCRFKFNDSLKTLYTPPKNLMQAEEIYQKVFSPKPLLFLTVSGKTTDEILEKEEKINIKDGIKLCDFISSTSRQKENIRLIKKLYKKDLDKYANFLPQNIITKLKKEDYKIYNPEEFPLNSMFKAGENTSYLITLTQTEGAFNPADKISELLKQIRKKCVKFIPLVFGVIFVFTSAFFGIKKGLKIVAAPFLASLTALMLVSTFGTGITLFHILGIFLIIGFGIDYSVFGMNQEEKTSDAITISACSSAFSFLLLGFTSFGIISSLGLILFAGIITSYLLSSIFCKS